MSKILIIIDMVEGFASFGNLSSENVKNIAQDISVLANISHLNGARIVHLTDSHLKNASEFNAYPVHCVIGSGEEDIVAELKLDFIKQIKKNSTNGIFVFNPLTDFDEIEICGCVTDICVYEYVMSLLKYKDQFELDATISVHKGLVTTWDAPGHDSLIINQKYLEKMRQNGAILI